MSSVSRRAVYDRKRALSTDFQRRYRKEVFAFGFILSELSSLGQDYSYKSIGHRSAERRGEPNSIEYSRDQIEEAFDRYLKVLRDEELLPVEENWEFLDPNHNH